MSLVTAVFLKNSYIYTGIYFIFLTTVLKQTWILVNTTFWFLWNDRKKREQVWQILALFCNLVDWILGSNFVKALRVTKVVNQILGRVRRKKMFPEKPFTKYLWQTLVFKRRSKIRESFNIYFSAVFYFTFFCGGGQGPRL